MNFRQVQWTLWDWDDLEGGLFCNHETYMYNNRTINLGKMKRLTDFVLNEYTSIVLSFCIEALLTFEMPPLVLVMKGEGD